MQRGWVRLLLGIAACAGGALADSATLTLVGSVPTGAYAILTPTSVQATLSLSPGRATITHPLGEVSAYGNAPYVVTAEVVGGVLTSASGATVPAEVALVAPGAPPIGFRVVDQVRLPRSTALTHVADLWIRVKTGRNQPGGTYAGTVLLTAAPR